MADEIISSELGSGRFAPGNASNDKLLKATHGSARNPLRIGDIDIPCYVLEDGTRVVSQRGIQKSINMSSGGRGPNAARLSNFVSQIDGKGAPFKDLGARIGKPILFLTPSGVIAYGYEATILADLCDAVLGARQQNVLLKQQMHIAERCELLVRAFARVGIIALVDEATGYQQVRDRNELHRILERYISKDLLPWAKRFPDSFYRELFRLRGWPYSPPSEKRPGYVGKLTNELVYDRLPTGVIDELKAKNPTVRPGQRRHKHHQFLTDDIGHPHLEKHLLQVVTLMRASKSWTQFMRMFRDVFPKLGDQLTFGLDDDE